MYHTIEGLDQAIADAYERRQMAAVDRDHFNHEMMRAHLAVIEADREIRRLETERIIAAGEPS